VSYPYIYGNGVNAALYHSNLPNSPELEKQHKSDPASFRSPKIPPLWGINQNFGVDVFVDCPMHLLFLGTYKSLNKIHLPRFLTPISKKTTAIKCINCFQANAPFKAHKKGVHFWGSIFPSKIDPKEFYWDGVEALSKKCAFLYT
jgi:hypothetical protein